jgi:hypothetical protein
MAEWASTRDVLPAGFRAVFLACVAVFVTRYDLSKNWVRPAVVVTVGYLVLHFLYWSFWSLPLGFLSIAPAAVIARATFVAWR